MEPGAHRPELLTSADLVVSESRRAAGASRPSRPRAPRRRARHRRNRARVAVAHRAGSWRSPARRASRRRRRSPPACCRRAGFDAAAGGNIGIALSEQVADSHPDAIHVVEVSSFQLESTDTFHPWIAVLLNLSPDHLDRHATEEEYAAAKARIFRNQTSQPTGPSSTPTTRPRSRWRRGTRARRFDFALDAPLEDGVTVAGDHIVERRAWRDDAGHAAGRGPSAGPTSARRRAGGVRRRDRGRCTAGRHAARRRALSRTRTRARVRRRTRRRAIRQRLEGHERDLGPPGDREL